MTSVDVHYARVHACFDVTIAMRARVSENNKGSVMTAQTLASARTPILMRRRFYVALSLVIAAIVFMGFWPTYFGPMLAGNVDKPPVIHLHATVYVGGLALFITQTVLAARGQTRLHLKLGKIGIGYGVLLVIVGIAVSFAMFAVRVQAGEMHQAQLSLLAPLVDMAVFVPYFGAAIYYRRKPELHKRLMIVATTALLIAAVGRMPFLGTPPNVWMIRLIWTSPILLAIGYDLFKRRVVHPIYVTGALLLVAEGYWRRGAAQSQTWADICEWLAPLFV